MESDHYLSLPVFDVNDILQSGWLLLDRSELDGYPAGSAVVLEITCRCGCPHSLVLRPGSLISMGPTTPDGANIDFVNVTWAGEWPPS